MGVQQQGSNDLSLSYLPVSLLGLLADNDATSSPQDTTRQHLHLSVRTAVKFRDFVFGGPSGGDSRKMSCQTLPLRVSLTAKWSQFALCAILLFSLPFCSLRFCHVIGPEAKPRTACMTPAQVRERALSFSVAFDQSCRVVGAPIFSDMALDTSFGVGRHRRQWVVNCVCAEREFQLVINDQTGNLSTLCCDDERYPYVRRVPITARLETERDAAVAAFQRLRDLQMVAPKEVIALVTPPHKADAGNSWQESWLVRDSPHAPPYHIFMILDRDGGYPLYVVNQRETEMQAER
jgi:hypothetical protein